MQLTWQTADETEFANKAKEINDRLHGIYNKTDQVAFSQSVFGNMVLSMRGWVLGFIQRRFAPNHHSLKLNKDVEGSLVSTMKLIVNSFSGRQSFLLTIGGLLCPFSSRVEKGLIQAGFSRHQVKNMRRTLMDALLILAYFLARLATAPPDDDKDDEEDNRLRGLAYYFSSRLLMEQDALFLPSGIMREKNSFLDPTPAGAAALWELCNIGYEFVGAQVAEKDNSSFYYQGSKEDKYEKGDPKWITHMIRYSPLRSMYLYEHPYEAYKSFEFGIKTRK